MNDGSTEQVSIEKLGAIDAVGLKVKIVNQKNQGVAAARNNGISRAAGKYVVCLDSDDILDPMYLEKCLIVLETNPNIDLVSTDMRLFGVTNLVYKQAEYDARELIHNNMVVTAAVFRKECWERTGGYKVALGYEDWEYWINLAENGFWGFRIAEPLFNYRTAASSRYIDDKAKHKLNMRLIRELHPHYSRLIRHIQKSKRFTYKYIARDELFVNLDEPNLYKPMESKKKHLLIVASWMTFGGAETLLYNYCREIKDDFNITFITTNKSEHEWEYKFKEVSNRIYHIPNLLNKEDSKFEFISNYIKSHSVDVIHLIHTDSILSMLPELKARHPRIKTLLTLFNDRVPKYIEGAIKYQNQIDGYVTDNNKVATSLKKVLGAKSHTTVVPNGIDVYEEFSQAMFDKSKKRLELNIDNDDIAVFFVGRLSEEKNPNIFIKVAEEIAKKGEPRIKFFVIGDGPMRLDIETSIRGTNNIVYLGYQAAVADYLSAADVFVLPSSVEGFPLSILEAMAMEVAVIASDVGAVAEVIESGVDGFVVKPGDVEEITEKLLVLASDNAKLKTFKAKSRMKVEKKYSNRILGANYKKLYEGVVS